jgi:hypothetical protein
MLVTSRRKVLAAAVGLFFVVPLAAPGHAADPVATAPPDSPTIDRALSPSAGDADDPISIACKSNPATLGPIQWLTLHHPDNVVGRVELVASSSCNTAWTHFVITNWGSGDSGWWPPRRAVVERQIGDNLCGGGTIETAYIDDGASTSHPSAEPECFTWWTTHLRYAELHCCSPGDVQTATVPRTGGNERHRRCLQGSMHHQGGGWVTPGTCGPWQS